MTLTDAPDTILCPCKVRQNASHVLQERATGFRKPGAPRLPFKQTNTQHLFQRVHLAR
jgi:hypothetical protein